MQLRGHGNHHKETPVEVDRTCPTKRPSVNNENNPALEPKRQEKNQKHHKEGQCRASLKPFSRPGDHQRG